MKTLAITLTMGLVFGAAETTIAQVLPIVTWNGPRHSSTAYEGARRGEAAYMQAYGQMLESMARAARDYEIARSQFLRTRAEVHAHHQRARETQFQIRTEYRFEATRSRKAPSVPAAEPRLSSREVDRTGTIHWPRILLSTEHECLRNQLQQLFVLRQQQGARGLDSPTQAEAEIAVKAMTEQLLKKVRYVGSHDYVMAKQFLQGLRREVKLPAETDVLAQKD